MLKKLGLHPKKLCRLPTACEAEVAERIVERGPADSNISKHLMMGPENGSDQLVLQ